MTLVTHLSISALPASVLVALVLTLAWVLRRRSRGPFPPGPPPKPIIGNALDITADMPWLNYWEWSKKLGSDIIHLSAMGTHIVVLHSMEDVNELMEKRSANYSSRPWIAIAGLLGIDNLTALIPYDKEWRKHRLIFQEGLGKGTMSLYYRAFTENVHVFIDLLLREPERFKDHCQWLSAAVTMSMTFGYDVATGGREDHYVSMAEQILAAATKLCHPSGTLINAIPFLRHVPPWFPGAQTQRWAAEVKKLSMAHKNEPFDEVKEKMLAGTAKECVSTRLLQRRLKDNDTKLEDEDELKDTLANVYLAGTETVGRSNILKKRESLICEIDRTAQIQASQLVFIMAMALYPSVQERAQAEIDRVVGTDRLPMYEDRPLLPYMEAVLRETLRWRLVAPLAIPHVTAKDDVYKGFFFPKGTLVVPNGWAISRDEKIYADPELFNPARFLNSDGTLNDDRLDFAYGYGRRICPGRFMANDVLWMVMAAVISSFNISKARDANGAEVEIDSNAFSSGLTSFPRPFKCSIVPRSRQAEMLVRLSAANAKESMK
ncbi:hypothetical protein APHAL10511_005308 [Amanita phalloides]|nr:hypothetical protein APHAL10511_005308 [Amanita phalloides]